MVFPWEKSMYYLESLWCAAHLICLTSHDTLAPPSSGACWYMVWCPLLALLMVSTLSLVLSTPQSMCGSYLHIRTSNNLPLVTKSMLIFVCSQMKTVGSETQTVACYIVYLQIVLQACIQLLSWQSFQRLTLNQFLLILRTLSLEPLGPKFLTVQILRFSFRSSM